ncbi:DUF1080 domain-containing protein [Larkinella bovis]|uniref:DUF1080 domain-containing protein n=1 Tax=Larkinella bovis TaxID=683041 RepID=A0ABW0II34_9BACT
MKKRFLALTLFLGIAQLALAQEKRQQNPESSEIWEPVPRVVTPGVLSPNTASGTTAPSDAIVLFDGKDGSQWVSVKGYSPEAWGGVTAGTNPWPVRDGAMFSAKGASIRTKQEFQDFQLHLEFRAPDKVEGNGQGRGNSGIFLQGRYELQVLDGYNNPTYSNGMVGSIYKQAIPLVNPSRKPGEWQTYDIIYYAPKFNKDGMMSEMGKVTVLLNGVLILYDFHIKGTTEYIGYPKVQPHGKGPLLLQDHGNPVGFRNIWIREL